ncbi:DNA repair protein RecO [Plesiocystis pacifica SIR-1]|uniref:DNA repair protein RecO n=1 Tax=Plesiocystis pacifica SIR-1 TaxID=391625 RepID=A6G167_9BACT|nr:DNA repair protein RecO [Plesiocystis pacifica]EDM80362.1 DNA repair protein RecO [Plesiocystis pacifica SIR-1]
MGSERSEQGAAVTPAVVLRTRAYREADLVVILLTPTLGKVDAFARAARRSHKRFPGGLPVGGRGEAVLGRGRGSLTPLDRFSPTTEHSRLGRDLEAFAYVNYLCELSDRLLGGSAADPTSFALLCDAIETALDPDARDPGTLRRFELSLLHSLGLLPALASCSVCGDPVLAGRDGVPFSTGRGGALCLAHGRGAGRVDPAVLELAEGLLATSIVGSGGEGAPRYADAEPPIRRSLRDLCSELIQAQLRSPLRSLAFFAQLPRTPPVSE